MSKNGYRLYDRWSTQPIEIEVPIGSNPNAIEVCDLSLWDNDLHVVNLSILNDNNIVWIHDGQLTVCTVADISNVLTEGNNVLLMDQDDFQGGQVLISFPYVEAMPTCDGACPGDATDADTDPSDGLPGGNGIVNIFDLQALANELLPLSPTFTEPTPAGLECFDITDTDTEPSDGLPGGDGTLSIFDLQAMANYLLPLSPTFSGRCIP